MVIKCAGLNVFYVHFLPRLGEDKGGGYIVQSITLLPPVRQLLSLPG